MLRALERVTYNLYWAVLRKRHGVALPPGVSLPEARRTAVIGTRTRRCAAALVASGLVFSGGMEYEDYRDDARLERNLLEARAAAHGIRDLDGGDGVLSAWTENRIANLEAALEVAREDK